MDSYAKDFARVWSSHKGKVVTGEGVRGRQAIQNNLAPMLCFAVVHPIIGVGGFYIGIWFAQPLALEKQQFAITDVKDEDRFIVTDEIDFKEARINDFDLLHPLNVFGCPTPTVEVDRKEEREQSTTKGQPDCQADPKTKGTAHHAKKWGHNRDDSADRD